MHEYIVEPNEDIHEIAKRFNCRFEEILFVNGLKDEKEVFAGKIIKIPLIGYDVQYISSVNQTKDLGLDDEPGLFSKWSGYKDLDLDDEPDLVSKWSGYKDLDLDNEQSLNYRPSLDYEPSMNLKL